MVTSASDDQHDTLISPLWPRFRPRAPVCYHSHPLAMTTPSPGRMAEEYPPWVLDQLVHPHTSGRGYYMRPAKRLEAADKMYFHNDQFWADALSEKVGAERNIALVGFNVF